MGYKSSGYPQQLPCIKMVFIMQYQDIPSWLKLSSYEDISDSVLLVFPHAVPDATGGRILP